MKKLIASTRNKFNRLAITGAAVLGTGAIASATDTPPVDLSAAGTSIAGYVPTAAGWAISVYVAIRGVKVLLRVFGLIAK